MDNRLPTSVELELRELGVIGQTAPKPAAHAEVAWPKKPNTFRKYEGDF